MTWDLARHRAAALGSFLLVAIASAATAERQPVLKQIDLPHPY